MNSPDMLRRFHPSSIHFSKFRIFSLLALFLLGAPLHAQQKEEEAEKKFEKNIQPTIPMDLNDPSLNFWKTFRTDMQDGREPGLINVQRFQGGFGFNGMPTFFKLPVALTPEDLKAAQVDVAILGEHNDMGSGFRGASYAPNTIRSGTYDYLSWGVSANPQMTTMINPFQDLVICDYGDAPVDPLSSERTVQEIRKFVKEIIEVKLENGDQVIPIVVGGDHSLMYPNVAAMVDVYGKGNVGVIHFDAHYDASKNGFGHLMNHAKPVYRLIDEGLVEGKNFIQIGLRGYYPGKESFEWMRAQGFRYHTMNEIEKRGWDAVLADALREANEGPKYLYISFDIDVIDPAYTPGTGTPEPGGISNREAFTIIRRLCAESNVVGFELVEFLPYRDPGYTTALNCNRILREALVGIAMRKRGIENPDYRSPLTVDDKR